MGDKKLPDDVRAAFLECAKNWLMTNYIGDVLKELNTWDDTKHLVHVQSYSLQGDTAKSLRRLVRLAGQGLLVERPRYRKGVGVRSFQPTPDTLDAIGAAAIAYWESLGYVVGKRMDKTEAHKQAEIIEAAKRHNGEG